MVAVLWAALYSTLPLVALCSSLDNCAFHDTSQDNVSLALTSLKCYNDYQSSIQCQWSEDQADEPLELWNWDHEKRESSPCIRYNLSGQTHGTINCEYRTEVFYVAKPPEIFFFKTTNLTSSSCSSSSPKPLKPSQYLRVSPPVNVAYRHEDELLQWSSPYPVHSSLSTHLVYQLSYRPEGNDTWITNDVTSTQLKLESEWLLPGCRYEARVRARGAVGWWSEWSRVGTWETKEAPGQVPRLQCVLDGEKEVTCSWKVKRNLAPFITYQLDCQHDQMARPESCCDQPAVSGMETELRYTCHLTVPDPSQLLLELRPTRNVRSFKSTKHIRPIPPANVSVTQDGNSRNWQVEWIDDSNAETVTMNYDVCYWNTLNETDKLLFEDVSSRFLNILSRDLVPSQQYRVTVRTRVAPHQIGSYRGIPSNWAEPVEWTSNEGRTHKSAEPVEWTSNGASSWIMSLVYVIVSVVVATVFFFLYQLVTFCRRSVMLWVKSVPSPDKSEAISDIMKLTDSCTLQRENAYYICEVQNLETSSDCPVPLLTLSLKHLPSEDGGCYDCDVSPTDKLSPTDDNCDELTPTDNSALSFSGPYILCPPQGSREPVERGEDFDFDCSSEDYVRLPNQKNSRSTEDLMLHSDNDHEDHHRGCAADCQADAGRGSPEPDAAQVQVPREIANNQFDYIHKNSIPWGDPPPPPPDTACTSIAWSQGSSGTTSTQQAGGYCAITPTTQQAGGYCAITPTTQQAGGYRAITPNREHGSFSGLSTE